MVSIAIAQIAFLSGIDASETKVSHMYRNVSRLRSLIFPVLHVFQETFLILIIIGFIKFPGMKITIVKAAASESE